MKSSIKELKFANGDLSLDEYNAKLKVLRDFWRKVYIYLKRYSVISK